VRLNLAAPEREKPLRVAIHPNPFIGDNPLMKGSGNGPRLIIVCGLPGSGKTTLAKELESGSAPFVSLPMSGWTLFH
jgi:SpoVK/Ycf46/Vps4 family AAA+-type ATPase